MEGEIKEEGRKEARQGGGKKESKAGRQGERWEKA
jgi:hypothetical protein